MKIPELIALLLYFVVLLTIGVSFYFKDRKAGAGEKTYFLGNRNMNGWVSALSAGASDMSAWVLMGLPGAIYLSGIGQVWIAVGLLIGTVLAWVFVAPNLRRFSIAANDSITVPQFLTNRFKTNRKGILLASAIVFMIAYCIYAASSISACGTLFNTVLGMDPMIAMIIATIVIVAYTFLGGYNAVCWTDFFQGLIMLGALLLAPILALAMMKSSAYTAPVDAVPANFFNAYSSGKSDWKSWSEIISGLGWGLGYFGMPHILIRYFSVRDEKEMKKSRIIGSIWIFIILAAASVVGLLGRNKKLSYSSVKKVYLAISACYRHALIDNIIPRNPCLGVALPSANEGAKEVLSFSPDEVEILKKELAKTDEFGKPLYHYAPAYLLILNTGLRMGEALSLQWGDINFSARTLRVNKTSIITRPRDENANITGGYRLETQHSTKTSSGRRTVPLNQSAERALLALQDGNRSPNVILNTIGTPAMAANFERSFQVILRNAGLPRYGIHSLRHTFASLLFAGGVEVKIISKLLGHASVKITYDTYVHLFQENYQSVTDILDNQL